MPISQKITEFIERSSWIRRMFEEGIQLKSDGQGPVYDFTLGNPELEPPAAFQEVLLKAVTDNPRGAHRYMTNAGFPATRQVVAQSLQQETGLDFTPEHILMSSGAAGGINSVIKALIDSGDEVLIMVPYFVEYHFYIDNHQGVCVQAPTTEQFDLDIAKIEAALSPKTRVVLINNPNNPTGVVYSQENLQALGELLRTKSRTYGRPIYLLDDAPYRKLIYDLPTCPSIFKAYEHSIMVTSHSKDLSLPGERIGFIAISPQAADAPLLFDAMIFTTRTLGYINAPALMQRVVAQLQDVTIDVQWYQRKRDLLVRELGRMGYSFVKPQGAFYLFPKAPGGDSLAFTHKMKENRVLVVPGDGFGCPGYFRISYCVQDKVVQGALPIFEKVFQELTQA